MWKAIRIFLLLVVLGTVAQQSFMEDADLNWQDNFYVAVYPVNADGSESVAQYISTLTNADLEPVAEYFAEEGERYGVPLRRPFELRLGEVVNEVPPAPPEHGSILDAIMWSLHFRYFAWQHSPALAITPDVRLYALYYNPETHPSLRHSTALNKGRIGRINLFGDQSYHAQNMVIVAHELLHTVKATDKYDLNTTLPQYPDGFAQPDKAPLYPQDFAELMGGRIPISETKAKIPPNLNHTLIGTQTAQEIGWIP